MREVLGEKAAAGAHLRAYRPHDEAVGATGGLDFRLFGHLGGIQLEVKQADGTLEPCKRGGARVIYYWHVPKHCIYLIYGYVKSKGEDLTPQQLKVLAELMKDVENG